MKRVIDVPRRKLVIFYRIIVVVMLLLVALLIAGSLYGLARSQDSGPLFRIGGGAVRDGIRGGIRDGNGGTGRGGQGGDSDGAGAYHVFSGIGTLRIQNEGKASGKAGQQAAAAVIIVSISFPYKADDRPFTEELASHLGEFRSIAINYFAGLPRDRLSRLDEEQAKADILRQYNALLRLGRIETLYFSDLTIVD